MFDLETGFTQQCLPNISRKFYNVATESIVVLMMMKAEWYGVGGSKGFPCWKEGTRGLRGV